MNEEELRQDAQMLWDDVVGTAAQMGAEALVPWLQRVEPQSFDGAVMKVSTRQKWTERKLMGEFRPLIESIMAEITMDPVQLLVHPPCEGAAVTPSETVPAATVPADTPVPAGEARPHLEMPPVQTTMVVNPAIRAIMRGETPAGASDRDKNAPLTAQGQAVAASPGPAVPEPPIQILQEGEEPSGGAKADSKTDFTFDTYIVGESNKIAYNMTITVAEQPDGSIFNPLFIWGPSGNGKTHLLLAIREYIQEHQPHTRVRYVTSNAFVTQYVDDIRNKKLKGNEVLREYRDIDVLLVDDVQFFEDKQESVTAFFDIFNDLMMSGGKQIVLAADRAPDYLRLDARMKTRFNQGIVADIKAPTYEMKISILKSFYDRCRQRNGMDSVELGEDVFETMAKYCPDNPRNMLGLVNNVMFRAESDPSTLSAQGIKATIDTMFKSCAEVSIHTIMRVVASEFHVPVEEMCSDCRVKNVKEARQVVMWLASQLTDEPYQAIGKALNRDHSTVSHGIKKVNERREQDKGYVHTLEDLKNKIVQ